MTSLGYMQQHALSESQSCRCHRRGSLQEATHPQGLQRHIWFPIPLLDGHAGTAYFSPVFDALWVADQPKHLENAQDGPTPAIRSSGGLQIFGAHVPLT